MIVYGIYTFAKAKTRATALRALVDKLNACVSTEKHRLVLVGGFLEATVKAAESIRDGTLAAVAGCLDDITLPTDHEGFGEVEWQESWLAYLEQNKVAFFSLPSSRPIDASGSAAASIIRGYNRAAGVLTESIRKLQSEQRRDEKVASGGYICGRPPYGYRVIDEEFVVNQDQAHAVRLIFEQCRAGKGLSDILALLKTRHAFTSSREGKPQFWDRVKIRRILNHGRLYCLGHYNGGRGQSVRVPSLAFLPPAWVDTHSNTAARAASAS